MLNFWIDYLLIYLTAVILKRNGRHRRYMLAALFASSIVFLLFSPYATFFAHPIVKVFYSLIIVWIAFGYVRFTYFIQGLGTFYFVTFVTGGGLIAFHFFIQHRMLYEGLGGQTTSSWLFVLFGFPLVWLFSKKRLTDIKWEHIRYDTLCDVTVVIDQQSLQLRGLIDSGNQLHDPLSRRPVMIVEQSSLYPLFGRERIEALCAMDESNSAFVDSLNKRMRIIPYKGIGQTDAYLIGIRPDYVVISYKNKRYVSSHCTIAIEQKTLSPNLQYNCIIHPKMLIHKETSKTASF